MTFWGPIVGDGALSVTAKSSVVVEVEELLPLPQTTRRANASLDDFTKYASRKANISRNHEELMLRPSSVGSKRREGIPSALRSDRLPHIVPGNHSGAMVNDVHTDSGKRNTPMRIPFFHELGRMGTTRAQNTVPLFPADRHLPGPFGATPLLTPPDEVTDIKWNTLSLGDGDLTASQTLAAPFLTGPMSHPINTVSSADSSNQSFSSAEQLSASHTPYQSRITLPSNTIMDQSQQGSNGQQWLDQALEHTVSSVATTTPPLQYIQMVAQLLPLRMNGATSAKPVFELVLEVIQCQVLSEIPPFITITHAVPHMIAMDEVPTSPPATPNAANSSDYFDTQTIFSHAAVVPGYHSVPNNSLTTSSARPSNPVVAPASIHVSVLERYLPPISSKEYSDFFTLSSRSYLVDRLAELSAQGGTLLLLYPTKSGAKTFTSKYLGPILEPLLRQFVFYNNLYSDLAEVLAEMTSVESMFEFEHMEAKVKELCDELSKRGLPRSGPRSTFTVIHSGTGKTVLDGSTWREAYIHQEQARMRRNLVEYQLKGGRMPMPVGNTEITHGMLVRQVTDGLRATTEAFGGEAVELGVFVIRRNIA